MVLTGHSDSEYLNVRRFRSSGGAQIMLSADTPVPTINGPVLTVAQIIKFVMSSAAEAEISSLFICAKAMVQIRVQSISSRTSALQVLLNIYQSIS